MAYEREGFESQIDFKGGGFEPYRAEEVEGHHSAPQNTVTDRKVDVRPEKKYSPGELEDIPRRTVVRQQEVLIKEGILALRIVDERRNLVLPVGDIVSTLSRVGGKEVLIWYRPEAVGPINFEIANKDNIHTRLEI